MLRAPCAGERARLEHSHSARARSHSSSAAPALTRRAPALTVESHSALRCALSLSLSARTLARRVPALTRRAPAFSALTVQSHLARAVPPPLLDASTHVGEPARVQWRTGLFLQPLSRVQGWPALASGLSSMPSIAERRCAPCAVRLRASSARRSRLRRDVGAERRALASGLNSTPSIAARRCAKCAVHRRAGSARREKRMTVNKSGDQIAVRPSDFSNLTVLRSPPFRVSKNTNGPYRKGCCTQAQDFLLRGERDPHPKAEGRGCCAVGKLGKLVDVLGNPMHSSDHILWII